MKREPLTKEQAFTEISLILNKLSVSEADWVIRMILGGDPKMKPNPLTKERISDLQDKCMIQMFAKKLTTSDCIKLMKELMLQEFESGLQGLKEDIKVQFHGEREEVIAVAIVDFWFPAFKNQKLPKSTKSVKGGKK